MKPYRLGNLSVVAKTFPGFRYPDFCRAAEALASRRVVKGKVNSFHYATLSTIIKGEFHNLAAKTIRPSASRLFHVAYQQEEVFPEDFFWVFHDETVQAVGVLRVSLSQQDFTTVELAVSDQKVASDWLKELGDLSVEHSVYRNQLVQIDYRAAIEEDYGEMHSRNELAVTFRADPQVTAEKIVLDGEVEQILERNVVRFHTMRSRLSELGLPLQRGVLLYGPPGTGKTYTCQYLYHRLKPVTMVVVSGKGLTEVRSICHFARTMQPSVIVLEDIDLIFSSREINLYSTGLGEMMDELDGFQSDESVTFILTTNAIDRLEKAIKDRPGRISQCIYMGPPTRELRERYLERFLKTYDTSALSIADVARLTDGASQAFLQELVYRAVQIAAEDLAEGDEKLQLQLRYFEEGFEEMTRYAENSTNSIVGFSSNR